MKKNKNDKLKWNINLFCGKKNRFQINAKKWTSKNEESYKGITENAAKKVKKDLSG